MWIHVVTDGRDVADGTAGTYLKQVTALAEEAGTGRIATVIGRGYAMDKAGNLELTARAVHLVADAAGTAVSSAAEAVHASDRGDEWVERQALMTKHGYLTLKQIGSSRWPPKHWLENPSRPRRASVHGPRGGSGAGCTPGRSPWQDCS